MAEQPTNPEAVEEPGVQVSPPVSPAAAGEQPEDIAHDITFLNDVQVTATVELGRTILPIRDVLKLTRGSVIELEKLVGQPADLMINGTLMARGEVIVINERFGFRITKFASPHGA